MDAYFKVKDVCRQGMMKYLEKACAGIPRQESYEMLDAGCGSGVPTLWLAANFPGGITAFDYDSEAIKWLNQKITERKLQDRIHASCISFDVFKTTAERFSLILAEGFLNVTGFENGFKSITGLLKQKGYLIIHDEYKDHSRKLKFISDNGCSLADMLYLDENIWRKDYYRQLEREINNLTGSEIMNCFKNEIEELKLLKEKPDLFRSVYYIVNKRH